MSSTQRRSQRIASGGQGVSLNHTRHRRPKLNDNCGRKSSTGSSIPAGAERQGVTEGDGRTPLGTPGTEIVNAAGGGGSLAHRHRPHGRSNLRDRLLRNGPDAWIKKSPASRSRFIKRDAAAGR